MAAPYAFVTLVSSDSYLPGALTLAAALKDIHPSPPVPPELDFQTVCLVTPEIVDVSTIKHLRRAFDLVVGVEVIDQSDEKGLKLLGRLDLNTVLTKFHIFRLTQFSKIIFLDADVLPIRPLSHLFTLPHEFSAVPDVGWPDIFNSGVMVLSPGEDKFAELTALFKSKGSWDGGDQGILNEWRGSNWNRLSFTYNTTPTAAYTYAPAYERFGSQISAIHFIGPNKPWNSLPYRASFENQTLSSADSSQQAYDYVSLLDRWYSVYDSHYRPQATVAQPVFELKRYESAWNEAKERGQEATLPSGSTLSLEELRKLAIEGMKAPPPIFDAKSGEGHYQSMPLDGRVDLMRPKKTVDTVAEAPVDPETPKQKKRLPPLENLSDSEELPRTPIPPEIHLQPASPQRWQTLSTPAPHELPPSPRLKNISLPATPTPWPLSHDQPTVTPDRGSPLPHELKERPQESRPEYAHPEQQQQQHPEPPLRPRSPPLLMWNPAVEPPPTTTPTPSAFPSDTYFPNIWDQTPTRQHDQPHQGTSPTSDSGAFFQAPPSAEIPDMLLRQGHYRNVTGESSAGSPSPDRTKVKTVFPWEEKPRQMPGRVFPLTDSPTPSLFLSPESQVSSSEVPTTPERKGPAPVLSPLSGLPFALTYTNAWDTVPSIQKYASRLARPPPARPLAPAFDEDGWDKRKSWDDKAEASSRDGDVEDEGDESVNEDARSGSIWDNDTDDEATQVSQRRSRRGSSGTSATGEKKQKQYRSFGVQTILPEMKSQGVQVNTIHSTSDRSSDSDRKPSMSKSRHWAPSGRTNVPPSVTTQAVNAQTGSSLIPGGGTSGATIQMLSPALRPSYTSPPTATVAPPTKVSRQVSNDSLQASPASSQGPLSPPDGQPLGSPLRKAGRVWDPARGVELFKRGSEEVLARFLKMGSWEDENR